MQLISIYQTTLIAAVIIAPALALLGCQLAARDRSLQTLCVSQGATLGVILGLGILQTLDADGFLALGPLMTAGLAATITFFYTEYGITQRASKSTFFAAVFCVLSALGYLATALFPLLESHLTHVYFGDVATLSEGESRVAALLGTVLLVVIILKSRAFTRDSFRFAVFGRQVPLDRKALFAFDLIALITISTCVQFLGFLYTVGFLFIPTSLLTISGIRGLKGHLAGCAMLSAFSALVGFLLSLQYTRLSTVPSLLITLLVFGLLLKGVTRLLGK